jgi:uncharacterized protein (DUF2235 family)
MDGTPQRKGSYPIQTPTYTPHNSLHGPSEQDEGKNLPLPRSIRALKNGKEWEANNHSRTVVICLDGTGDRFDADNSNVVHFVSCLKKHKPAQQVTYYQSGIGTYGKGGIKNGIGAALDMAVGSGLGVHIKDAYKFLMQNYREGDRICLLGFSRGAYTIRCLAGMLHKVGLLPASNGAQVNFAFDFYKDDTPEGWRMSAQFKKTFCTNVNVYFVGLWDCVVSVGFFPRKLPFSKTPTNSIHYFRHAMALDEHRSKFKVCQWQHQDPNLTRRATTDHTFGAQISRGFKRTGILKLTGNSKPKTVPLDEDPHPNGHIEKANGVTGTSVLSRVGTTKKEDEQMRLQAEFDAYDRSRKDHQKVETDALEVWFKGCHADIGGGAVANETRHMLSRIPLRWMIRQCFECDTGIAFDTAALAEIGLDVHTLYPKYKPVCKPPTGPSPDLFEKYENEEFPPLYRRSAFLELEGDRKEDIFHMDHRFAYLPECTEDYFDGLGDVHDQLVDAKSWWVLEVWPVKVRILARDGEGWEKRVRMNLGRYRAIRESAPKLHWTVERLVQEGRYEIKGRVDRNTHWETVT